MCRRAPTGAEHRTGRRQPARTRPPGRGSSAVNGIGWWLAGPGVSGGVSGGWVRSGVTGGLVGGCTGRRWLVWSPSGVVGVVAGVALRVPRTGLSRTTRKGGGCSRCTHRARHRRPGVATVGFVHGMESLSCSQCSPRPPAGWSRLRRCGRSRSRGTSGRSSTGPPAGWWGSAAGGGCEEVVA